MPFASRIEPHIPSCARRSATADGSGLRRIRSFISSYNRAAIEDSDLLHSYCVATMVSSTATRVTVQTEVLEAALRGGEPARVLSQRCSERRASAESALVEALKSAPTLLADTRARSNSLLKEKGELVDELDALSASLDDLVGSSERITATALVTSEKLVALDALLHFLEPLRIVSAAIHAAEAGKQRDIVGLQECLAGLENATRVASESDFAEVRGFLPQLQDHVSETVAMMQFRFLDLVTVTEGAVSVQRRGTTAETGKSPADALAKAGLLEEALGGIVAELKKKSVAKGLRAAPVFSVVDGGNAKRAGGKGSLDGPSIAWEVSGSSDFELLEFAEDLDEVPEHDTDAMAEALDISNAASRAIALFDLLRDNITGDAHSATLASILLPWIVKEIVPVSSVLTSVRAEYADDGVPPEALKLRVLALSASARVLQGAMQSRGADPSCFVIDINTSEIERDVAGECRAQAVLSARRAIGSFADARHNVSQMMPCPLSAQEYTPQKNREADYFPPCLVSLAATAVLDVFSRTRTDAMQAMSSRSTVIGHALLSAAYECVDAYRVDVPLQHGDDMRGSLRLKALYYNDCMMLKHACQRADEMDRAQNGGGESSDGSYGMQQVYAGLSKAAESVMMSMRRTAEKGLMDNINSACRNGALGAYGTLVRIQRASALMAAYNAIRELVEVFADLIPTEIAEMAGASLCEKYIRKLCDAIAELEEILPNGCDQIDAILDDATSKTDSLMRLVSGMNQLRGNGDKPEIVLRLEKTRRRAEAYRHVVTARMEEIVGRFRDGKYEDGIDRAQVEMFLLKIFEDTPLRASFIRDLGVSTEAEADEWGNAEW